MIIHVSLTWEIHLPLSKDSQELNGIRGSAQSPKSHNLNQVKVWRRLLGVTDAQLWGYNCFPAVGPVKLKRHVTHSPHNQHTMVRRTQYNGGRHSSSKRDRMERKRSQYSMAVLKSKQANSASYLIKFQGGNHSSWLLTPPSALGFVLIILLFSQEVACICHLVVLSAWFLPVYFWGSSCLSILYSPCPFQFKLAWITMKLGSVYYETIFSETLWVFRGFQRGLLH